MPRGRDAHSVVLSIGRHRHFDWIGLAILLEVCDSLILGVVLGVGPKVSMCLINCFDGGDALQGFERLRIATLGGSIAHDRDGGRKRID